MTFFLLIDILPNKAIPNFIFDELPAESFHVDVKNNLQDKLFSNGRRTKEEETNEKGSTVFSTRHAVYMFHGMHKPENGGQTDDSRVLNLAANHTYQPLDPNTQNSLACKWVWYQVYEGLIYYNNEEHTIEPRVAESWTVSDDELTYTFTLRDGVKFHNGEPVTVEDVVFSFNRAKEGPCYTNHVAAIDTVKAVGDDKVEIKLKHTYAPFWQYLSEIYIMNKNFVNERNGDISDAACGTGPYKIVEADLAVAIKAEAFEDYYRGLAKIKKIVWNIISDSSSAAMALQSGDLDYLEIAWSQVALLEADENLVISPMQSLHTSYLAFNCQNEIFKDVRVRQGISYLLDREEIALMAFEGFAEVDSFVMHPNLAGMPDKSAIAATITLTIQKKGSHF